LKNIFFVGGQPIILESSLPELNNLLKLLIDNKTLRIQIEGHICCVGPVEGVDDNNLSVFRAKAVYDYLTSKGIDAHRLTFVGLGNRNPVSREENTEEDREKNRRVEIRILNK
jgi:outer membrane protein OmpA-like peptidoglycan-associated protein